MRWTLILVLLLAGCSAQAEPPKTDARWTQVFRDDFDGPKGQLPSAANWRFDIGHCYPGCATANWGTGEIARMTDSPSNVAADGEGRLAITPLLRNGEWTSARIESVRSDFAYPKSGTLRVEVSLRLPQVSTADGAGYWPAVWMMGAPIRDNGYTGWPVGGEIDIMEQLNGRPGFYSAVHTGTLDRPVDFGSAEQPCAACANGFHIYAVELTAKEARFYLDGVMHHSAPVTIENAFFLILNVAMGGNWPGAPNASTVDGKPMLVDYLAVYTRAS